MKRNIRKRAFLLISNGFSLSDIPNALSQIPGAAFKVWKKFDPTHPIDSIKNILNDPQAKNEIKEEINRISPSAHKQRPGFSSSKAIEEGVGSTSGGPPPGYHPTENLTPEIVHLADQVLGKNKEAGYYESHIIDGRNLRFQVERHFDNHPKLDDYNERLKVWKETGELGPKPQEPESFSHPGVSVYETEASNQALNQTGEEGFLKKLEDMLRENSKNSSLASRVVDAAQTDKGVKETSDNFGPEIEKYFEALNIKLPETGLPWCAAAVSSWLRSAGVPIKGSAGSLEIREQFKSQDKWAPAGSIFRKDLVPGNVIVWSREGLGSGKGHVAIISKVIDDNTVEVIEGNGIKSDSVATSTRKISDPRVLGIGLVSEMS